MKHFEPSSTNTRIAVWAVAGCLLTALVLATALLIWNVRKTALSESEAQVVRFISGAEAAMNRSLLSFDVLLASTSELLDLPGSVDGDLAGQGARQLLRSAARQNLLVRYVAVMDESGKVVAASDLSGLNAARDLPPGFFDEAMGQPVPVLVASPPTVSFSSSERVIFFARMLQVDPQRRLLAVVQVPVNMLVSVLMQGADIPALEVTMEHGVGDVLLGVSGRGEMRRSATVMPLGDLVLMAGTDVASARREPKSAAGDPGESGGLGASLAVSSGLARWNLPARLSGVSALVVARPILYPDLWISASLPVQAALANWRSERNAIVLVTLMFGITLLAAAGFSVAYLNRMNRARRAMKQSQATLQQALTSLITGFLLLDSMLRVLQWNPRFVEIYPWLAPVIRVGMPFQDLLEESARYLLSTDDTAARREWVGQRMLQQRFPRGTHEQELPNGHCIQITERATPDGGMVISYNDVTDMRRASAEIESLAFYDPLTGLPNRRLLLDRLNQAEAAAERSGERGALLFLDLDEFKTLNDTLGHEVGDQLLQQVARRLSGAVRATDTVARLGGDEFVVMLHDLSSDNEEAAATTRRIGEKILHHLNQPYQLGTYAHQHTCSIGATLFGHKSQPAAELLKQADIAMYQVKAQRGNGLCFFDPAMQEAISARAKLEADMREALTFGQFVLHYQPQCTLSGRLVGVEALIRWQHPQRGLVMPGQFIGVAEDSEFIVPLGQWVLRTACEQLALWEHDPLLRHLHLAVNVSARQFHQADFVPQLIQVIQQTGIRPHLLELELTESLVLDNVEESVAKMHLLRTKGVRFSVDDFGTGYSSLAYLTQLPLHQLKIDQSFVRNLGLRHTDSVIVQTIIGMARNLELEVIAEGVETEAQRDFLASFGCHLYQGYLLGRPMPADQLRALALERSREQAQPATAPEADPDAIV